MKQLTPGTFQTPQDTYQNISSPTSGIVTNLKLNNANLQYSNNNGASYQFVRTQQCTEETNRAIAAEAALQEQLNKSSPKISTNTKPKLNKCWFSKLWDGLTSFSGENVWTDGNDIYYSQGSPLQYYFSKSLKSWQSITWNLFSNIYGENIWTDGRNIYYNDTLYAQRLDSMSTAWVSKQWNVSFLGQNVWTDGENIYLSQDTSKQYVYDKSNYTWTPKTWGGYTALYGRNIWTDGENIYYSNGPTQYYLDKKTSTWLPKNWNGQNNFFGFYTWTDGENIYNSRSNIGTYILDKKTSTWTSFTWYLDGDVYNLLDGYKIWTDGDNIYYNVLNGSNLMLSKSSSPILRP